MKRKLEPIKLKTDGKSAWMYVNKHSLEIFIAYDDGRMPVSAKVMLSQLQKVL